MLLLIKNVTNLACLSQRVINVSFKKSMYLETIPTGAYFPFPPVTEDRVFLSELKVGRYPAGPEIRPWQTSQEWS